MRRFVVLVVVAAGLVIPSKALAATVVCSVHCDTRDPSLARQETFPVPESRLSGRRVVLHVSDVDGMAWGSVDDGLPGDSVWLDRSWGDGSSWEGLLGKASIPSTWTGTRTLMYNLADPATHRRGMIRACGDAQGVACTAWAHVRVCDAVCDGAGAATAVGDSQPVLATATAAPAYVTYAQRQADAIWQRDRDALARVGLRWSGATPKPPRLAHPSQRPERPPRHLRGALITPGGASAGSG